MLNVLIEAQRFLKGCTELNHSSHWQDSCFYNGVWNTEVTKGEPFKVLQNLDGFERASGMPYETFTCVWSCNGEGGVSLTAGTITFIVVLMQTLK